MGIKNQMKYFLAEDSVHREQEGLVWKLFFPLCRTTRHFLFSFLSLSAHFINPTAFEWHIRAILIITQYCTV